MRQVQQECVRDEDEQNRSAPVRNLIGALRWGRGRTRCGRRPGEPRSCWVAMSCRRPRRGLGLRFETSAPIVSKAIDVSGGAGSGRLLDLHDGLQPAMVERMSELVALGLQILAVLVVGRHLDRDLLDDVEPVGPKA